MHFVVVVHAAGFENVETSVVAEIGGAVSEVFNPKTVAVNPRNYKVPSSVENVSTAALYALILHSRSKYDKPSSDQSFNRETFAVQTSPIFIFGFDKEIDWGNFCLINLSVDADVSNHLDNVRRQASDEFCEGSVRHCNEYVGVVEMICSGPSP